MEKEIDCVVCGSCTADILVRPVALGEPVGLGRLHRVEPIEVTTGGLASNAGIAMAKLGLKVAMLSYTGEDDWSRIMRAQYKRYSIDTSHLFTHPTLPSSSTVVMTDPSGERSFAHYQGAPKDLSREIIMSNLDFLAKSRVFLIGYYSLLPNIQDDLPKIFEAIRETGCKTAMDAAGTGGDLSPLDRILPHLDFYVPSYEEAKHQTKASDPRQIIETFRQCGATGMLGVKLGDQGALLQTGDGEFIEVPAVKPPGPVVDTTGAGDSFYAGLIAGTLSGFEPSDAAKIAAAAGATCVTGYGASTAINDIDSTKKLAGVT